jgi:hypothetical protein
MEEVTCPHCGQTFDHHDERTRKKLLAKLNKLEKMVAELLAMTHDQHELMAVLTEHFASLLALGPDNLHEKPDSRN